MTDSNGNLILDENGRRKVDPKKVAAQLTDYYNAIENIDITVNGVSDIEKILHIEMNEGKNGTKIKQEIESELRKATKGGKCKISM